MRDEPSEQADLYAMSEWVARMRARLEAAEALAKELEEEKRLRVTIKTRTFDPSEMEVTLSDHEVALLAGVFAIACPGVKASEAARAGFRFMEQFKAEVDKRS